MVGVRWAVCGGALAAVATVNAISSAHDAVALNQHAMIMAHDAGSGYLGSGVIDKWAKTQSGGIIEQLDCGARAFDARPAVVKGELRWHHGPIHTKHRFDDSMADVLAWARRHPDELVIFAVSHCEGESCFDMAQAAAVSHGITPVTNCAELNGLTVGSAKKRGRIAGQPGAFLFVATPYGACSNANYDSSIVCHGYSSNVTATGSQCLDRAGVSGHTPVASLSRAGLDAVEACATEASVASGSIFNKKSFSCYTTSNTKKKPLGKMFAYLDSVAAVRPAKNGVFSQHQALWQENVDSIVIGFFGGSSLLGDEQKSQLNDLVTDAVSSGRWKYINFLEVNNVCDHKGKLFEAVTAFNANFKP